MKDNIRNFVSGIAPALWQYRALFSSKYSYLNVTGWRESVRRGYPCRSDGSEVPWMNYSMISFLEDRLTKELTLFEYGSGFSTLFYSRLVGTVYSVENDARWFEEMHKKLPANASIFFVEADENGNYAGAIERVDPVDIVIVDGRDRVNCLERAISKLTERGVIVLDDSNRSRYQMAYSIAMDAGFRVLDLDGIKPTGFELHRSSLFYRPSNCLGL